MDLGEGASEEGGRKGGKGGREGGRGGREGRREGGREYCMYIEVRMVE